ncbi:MAG: response regulator [Synechococcales cyanobacterium RU_4_20]|nr:response regulator [Synechococcales cyanobacterium RU_4_20]
MKAEEASKPLVLCVDDNEKICQQLGEVIESAGYRYLGLQDSVKALQMAIEQKPSLIFVDLVMPVIGGYELCSQLRRISAFKETPLVILTAMTACWIGCGARWRERMPIGQTRDNRADFGPARSVAAAEEMRVGLRRWE